MMMMMMFTSVDGRRRAWSFSMFLYRRRRASSTSVDARRATDVDALGDEYIRRLANARLSHHF